jgi:SWI/SNF-related matrix-associated actin-dependent regulator of chromatin subfamily A member 5
MYYKDVLNTGGRTTQDKKQPRAPKQPNIFDHQFYPARLQVLLDKEIALFRKSIGYKVELASGSNNDLAQREAEQRILQLEIANAEPLTEEEEKEKLELLSQGYSNWNRRDFQIFIQASSKYGRNSINLIASEFPDKTIDEVRDYAKAFWKNYKQIDGYERNIANIEQGEERIRKAKLQKEALRVKLSHYINPLQDLSLKFPPSSSSKRVFSEEEDRYLIIQLYRFGLDRPDLYERMRDSIRSSPLFRFDFFIQSRTPTELARRCQTLLACVVKEFDATSFNGQKKRPRKLNTPSLENEIEDLEDEPVMKKGRA